MCPRCEHRLAWYDLVPLVSWLSLRARCRYCKKPISIQYPLVELVTAAVFALSYVYWPFSLSDTGSQILLAAWLVSVVGLIIIALYDLRWMLVPLAAVLPSLAVAIVGRAAYIGLSEPRKLYALGLWALSLVIASGVFWLIYLFSKGKLIGFGDVQIGLITGTLLGHPGKSLLMIFEASLIGTLVALPDIIRGKKGLASRMPYGPFLIIGTFMAMIFGSQIIDWYSRFMGLK